MTFSSDWNNIYLQNHQLSIWPWSDLVGYVNRYAMPLPKNAKVLEIGFGAGANIPFFLSIGANYYGIEGSEIIVERVRERYPELKDRLIAGDFITHDFQDKYDLLIDRSSMTHNTEDAIRAGLRNMSNAMNKGAKYIGIDWFSTSCSDYSVGVAVDKFTRYYESDSPFSGVGNVHFSSKEHIAELFNEAGFKLTRLSHKLNHNEIPNPEHLFATWNFVAEKVN
jgi:hypothetical protein